VGREDISSIRGEPGWQRVSCDTAGCNEEIDVPPGAALAPGWSLGAEAAGVDTAGGERYFCPAHDVDS
jgi:hypothetical protein